MKIILVVHQFFPAFSAGTEVLTLSVARELRRRGHQVRIVAGHPGSNDLLDAARWVQEEVDGFAVDRFHHAYVPMGGQSSMIDIGSDNVIAAAHFECLLRAFKPDRVHYFHLNRLGTGLILKAKAAEVRQSFTPTDFWAICATAQLRLPNGRLCDGPSKHAGNCVKHFAQHSSRAAIVRMVARAAPTAVVDALVPLVSSIDVEMAKSASIADIQALDKRLAKTVSRLNQLDQIAAPSAFMRAKLIEHGVRPELLVDVPFGIDLARSSPNNVRNPVQDGPLRVGFIGTLAAHKGAHVLVNACARLPVGCCSFRIYGDFNEFPEYVGQLTAQLAGLQNIDFAGTFPNAAIFDVLAGLDVLVVPSLWYENTPLVVYSAQAAGKIVVASDHPGITAVVRHGVDGLLFPAGDAEALAQQLYQLAFDAEYRSRLISKVRQPRSTEDYVDDLLALWGS